MHEQHSLFLFILFKTIFLRIESFHSFKNQLILMDTSASLIDDRFKKLTRLDFQASQFLFTDIQQAQKYLGELNLLLKEIPNPDFELNYHLNTAIVENQLYNYNLSEIHFVKAIEILNERGDASQLAEAFIDYAGTLINLGKVDLAFKFLEDAGKYLKTFPDDQLEAYLTCRLGYLHIKNSNKVKALKAFLEAEKRFRDLSSTLDLKDFYFLTLVKSGLGKIHELNQEHARSTAAYKEVVEFCEKKGMRSRLSWHYLNVGNSYMATFDDDNAIQYFKKGIKVIDDVNQQARALAYANLGYCYLRKGLFQEGTRSS